MAYVHFAARIITINAIVNFDQWLKSTVYTSFEQYLLNIDVTMLFLIVKEFSDKLVKILRLRIFEETAKKEFSGINGHCFAHQRSRCSCFNRVVGVSDYPYLTLSYIRASLLCLWQPSSSVQVVPVYKYCSSTMKSFVATVWFLLLFVGMSKLL